MSLKKIAEMVGTSPSTVSRVLNHTSDSCASKELSRRIWDAAQEIGYRPNESARNLRRKESQDEQPFRVSVVMARFHELRADPFFEDLMDCLKRELFAQGALLHQVIYDENEISDIKSTDGVIILGRCSRELLDAIRRKTRHVVGIWRNSMEFDVDEVLCDGRKAAEMAMEHLYSLGHRKIAYIGVCSHESRYVGYCNSLIQHGLPMDYDLIKPTNQTSEGADGAIRELLDGEADFTAIFCANDVTAVRVLDVLNNENKRMLREERLRSQIQTKQQGFPSDEQPRTRKRKGSQGQHNISVISIDNMEDCQNTTPYLTSIQIPRAEMAHMAVNLLIDRMQGHHQEMIRVEFPCRLIRRDSCYPVGQSG